MTPQMSIAITGKNMTKPAFDAVVSDANRAAGAVSATGGRMGTAMGDASFHTSNLAAQFNDIGVMLASGQSPLLLAIQQGTQISQVLGPMKAGAAVLALKTALMSLLSPVTLITIGSIAAGAALVQWLMSAQGDAESATEAFERHRKEIDGIVSGYGAAETAVGAYFDAVSKLPRSIATSQLNSAFEGVGAEVDAFRAQMASFANDPLFAKFGSDANRTMQDLAGSFADGDITAEEFYRSLEEVKDQLNLLERAGAAIPGSTRNMIDAWQEGALKAIQFGNGIANLVAQSHALAGIAQDSGLASFFEKNSVEGALDALKSLTPELRTQQQIIEDTYKKALTNPALTDEGRSQLEVAKEEALAAVASAAARREAASAAGQQADAYAGVAANLEHELMLVGMSEREQEVLNNVRAAGVDIASEQGIAIRAMTEDLYDQQEAMRLADEAQRELEKTMGEYGRVGQTAVRGIIDAFADFKIEASEIGGIISGIGSSLLNMGLNALFSGFGGGGSPLAGLFGFSEGGGGVVGGTGGYAPGAADDTLFVAKAQKGEPFAFGQEALDGLAPRSQSRGSLTLNLSGLGLSAEAVGQLVNDAIDRFDRMSLPGRVQAINADPLARG